MNFSGLEVVKIEMIKFVIHLIRKIVSERGGAEKCPKTYLNYLT